MTTPTRERTVTTSSGGGIGCLGVAIFISVVLGVLKVGDLLEVGWLAVFAPVLVVGGLVGVALLVLLIALAVGATILAVRGRRG